MFPIPVWVLFLLGSLGLAAFISLMARLVISHFVDHEVLRRHHDLAGYILGTFGVLYTVFVGFTIVNLQDRQIEIVAKINKEAYLSADLYRATYAFDKGTQEEMQRAISGYVKSIIDDEWSLMRAKKESRKALERLEELWGTFYRFEPKNERERMWFGEALTILFNFNNARLERIYSSWETLNSLTWAILISGGVILILFLFFFGTENRNAQMVLNILFIFYFVFSIYVIYALDHPLEKPVEVGSKAYQIVYDYYTETRAGLKFR